MLISASGPGAWNAFRYFFLLIPYRLHLCRWYIRSSVRWCFDQRGILWRMAWCRFPRASAWWARFLVHVPGWHSWLFLRKRVTVTCDRLDVTRDCVAFNRRAGLVRCYVASEDRKTITGRPCRVIACLCSKCGQEPPAYVERYKSPDRYRPHQVRKSGPKGLLRCPWCGGRWTIGALQVEHAGTVAVFLKSLGNGRGAVS